MTLSITNRKASHADKSLGTREQNLPNKRVVGIRLILILILLQNETCFMFALL
jgi:hypothetical protein